MQNCVMKTCFAEFNSAGMFGKGKQGVEELGQVGLFMQQGFVQFDKLCGALISEEDQDYQPSLLQGKRGRDSAVIEIMRKYGLKLNTER